MGFFAHITDLDGKPRRLTRTGLSHAQARSIDALFLHASFYSCMPRFIWATSKNITYLMRRADRLFQIVQLIRGEG